MFGYIGNKLGFSKNSPDSKEENNKKVDLNSDEEKSDEEKENEK